MQKSEANPHYIDGLVGRPYRGGRDNSYALAQYQRARESTKYIGVVDPVEPIAYTGAEKIGYGITLTALAIAVPLAAYEAFYNSGPSLIAQMIDKISPPPSPQHVLPKETVLRCLPIERATPRHTTQEVGANPVGEPRGGFQELWLVGKIEPDCPSPRIYIKLQDLKVAPSG